MNNKLLTGLCVVAVLVSMVALGYAAFRQLPEAPQQAVGTAGDTASTSRTAMMSCYTATTTWCSLYNYGSRDRIITNWYVFKDASSTGANTNVLAATSTSPSGNPAGNTAMFNHQLPEAQNAFIIATSSMPGRLSTTTSAHLMVWKAGTYLNLIASGSLNTTESAIFGVDYFIGN